MEFVKVSVVVTAKQLVGSSIDMIHMMGICWLQV